MDKNEGKTRAVSESVRFSGHFDPTHVLDNITGPSILLESADIATKRGEKSILLIDLALRLEAKDHEVMLTALLPEAKKTIESAKAEFSDRVRQHDQDILRLKMEDLSTENDLIKKLSSPSLLDVLRKTLKNIELCDTNNRSALMLSGVFAYDFLDHFEKLPEAKKDVLKLPDFLFFLPLTVVVIDHPSREITITAHALVDTDESSARARAKERLKKAQALINAVLSQKEPEKFVPVAMQALDKNSYSIDVPDEQFGLMIEQCKEHIKAGDVYQIVPSRTFSRTLEDPLKCYQVLRRMNPSPYMFYVRAGEWTLFGASPETFIKVDEQGTRVSVRPIAGTRRRGLNEEGHIDEELDSREQASLCLDEKELAEHMMLVDLARNDIASVAEGRTRRVKRLLGVDRYSHVMHLVSEVEGKLKDGFDALSAYQASMNMGTLMGAPKVRAAELLRTIEHSKRGFYGGAVGYINAVGEMDTSIIIRSAVVKEGKAYVRAGCGVVYDSNRAFEVQETVNKAEAVLKAMELASAS